MPCGSGPAIGPGSRATFPGARLQGKRQGNYSQIVRTLRSAMSTWKWFLCALLASGPSTVPNTPHAARCAARRNWALPVRGSTAGKAGLDGVALLFGPAQAVRPGQSKSRGSGGSWDLHGNARQVDPDAGTERLRRGNDRRRLRRRDAILLPGCGSRGLGFPLFLGSSSLRRDLTSDRTPIGNHHGRLPLGGDERADVERIDTAMLAQAAILAAVGVPARVGTHGRHADDRGSQVLARQRLHIALQPAVQGGDHVAGQGGRGRKRDLRIAADAHQPHGRRRSAFRAFAHRGVRQRHDIEPLEHRRAARLGQLDFLLGPRRPASAGLSPPCLAARVFGQTCSYFAAGGGSLPASDGGVACCAEAAGVIAKAHNTAAVAQRMTCISEMPLLSVWRSRRYAPHESGSGTG